MMVLRSIKSTSGRAVAAATARSWKPSPLKHRSRVPVVSYRPFALMSSRTLSERLADDDGARVALAEPVRFVTL